MYFLDTNALYTYIGREKLLLSPGNKIDRKLLCEFLDNRDDIVLAASAYIEAMVKFRNNPKNAKIVNDFINIKKIRLFNNVQYYGYDTNGFFIVTNLDEVLLQNHIKNQILPNKIEIETKFSVIFYEIMLLLYLKFIIDKEYTAFQNRLVIITEFVKNNTLDYVSSELKAALKDAYENHEGHEEQIFKNAYIDLLETGCKLVDIIMGIVNDFHEDSFENDLMSVKDKINAKYIQLRNSRPQNYLMENMDCLFKFDKTFIDFAKPVIASMFSEYGKAFLGKEKYAFKVFQLKYLEEVMFSAWMENNQKLKKNDIFDFLFFGCADFKDDTPTDNKLIDRFTYLLTFDTKLDKFIEKNNPYNGSIIRRFYNF